MEFLSEIIAKEVQTLAHATGQRYLKINDQGKVFGTTDVEETDPTVPAYVKAITSGKINTWDQAYSWGNHANAGYVTLSGAQTITGPKTFSLNTFFDANLRGEVITDLNITVPTGYMKILSPGFQPLNRPGGNYFQGIHFSPLNSGSIMQGQLGVMSTGTESSFVLRTTDPTGVWFPWRTMYHSGNFVAGTHYQPAGNYVNRAGDTMTGGLILPSATFGSSTVSGEMVSFDGSSGAGLRAQNSFGYVSITPLNTGWAHIYTDRSNFIFNKKVYSVENAFSSYNNDLLLQRNGSTRLTLADTMATFATSVTAQSFVKSGGTASQFLKADGSVDSNSYALTSHVHSSLTPGTGISGSAYNGGSTQTWSFDTAWGDLRYFNTNGLDQPYGTWSFGTNYWAAGQSGVTYKGLNSMFNDRFLGRKNLLYVTLNGVRSTSLENGLFSGSHGNIAVIANAGDPDVVLNINTVTNGLTNSNGFTYAEGFFMVHFYPGRYPQAMTARWKNRDGIWTSITPVPVLKYGSEGNYNGWKINLSGTYLTDLELTITPQASGGQALGISAVEYIGTRMALSEGPLVTVGGGNVYGSLTANAFIVRNGTSSQFLKADGSVDSNTYATQSWVTSQNYQPAGNYLTTESDTLQTVLWRGNTSATEIYLTAVGLNTAPAVDGMRLSGYGLMGNRTSTYITNTHASGQVIIGTGGIHNAGNRAVFNATGLTVYGAIIKNGGTSSQFLKADGSVDSTAYQPAGSYGLTSADITAVGLTASMLTLTRADGNLTASVPTWNQNTTGSAATLTTPRTLTIGSTGKTFNGSANVSWSLAEIGAAASVHSHSELITGVTSDLNSIPNSEASRLTYHRFSSTALNQTWAINNANGVLTMQSHAGTIAYGKQIAFGDSEDLYIRSFTPSFFGAWRRVYHDNYHPEADKWTTARTLTIGSTGKAVDGSANVSWSLAEIGAQVAGDYVTRDTVQTIPAAKTFSLLTANNGIRFTGDNATYIENIAFKNNTNIPTGYIKFVTPIRTSHFQMFSIDITGYDYNLGKSIDFTVVGYTYGTTDTVINDGFSNRSSFGRSVRIALEDRGAGYRVMVICLGDPDTTWYYQKFGATVRMWGGSHATLTADQFSWVNGETTLAAGNWLSGQLNNMVMDGELGTITTNQFIKTGGLSTQFLKANGSVDSTNYWHAGNDGSGSGLDADLLDGNHASAFALASHTHTDYMLRSTLAQAIDPNTLFSSSAYRIEPHANSPENTHFSYLTYGNQGNVTAQIATKIVTGETYIRAYNVVWSSWRKVWDSVNFDPASKANASHTHAASDITSGVLSYDRLPISSTDVTNWNNAFSWGNHAAVGYGMAVDSVFYVEGNTSGTSGTWTGTNAKISSYYDGLTISFKIGVAGAATTTLNLNGLGARTVRRNTGNLTTHLPVGTVVILTYTTISSVGYWVWADYDANTTYSAMSLAEMQAGIVTTGRVVQATVLNQWADSKYAPTSHNHLASEITDLASLLANKADNGHTHNWFEINNKPNFNNATQRLQINGASLSGTGSIEQQVADYINANETIVRTEQHNTLFVEITDYDPGTGGGGSGVLPGETSLTDQLQLYYDFGASNWFTGTGSTITNFSLTNTITGTMSGGVDHRNEFGGYMKFEASSVRSIITNQAVGNLGLNGPNSITFVMRAPVVTGDTFVLGSTEYQGNNTALHAGIRNAQIFRGHYANDVIGGSVSANTWYHITLTQDASGSKAYLNGTQIYSLSHSYLTGTAGFYVGRFQGTYYTLDLGLIMVHSKCLTPTEVNTLYEEQRSRFGI